VVISHSIVRENVYCQAFLSVLHIMPEVKLRFDSSPRRFV